MRQYTAEEYEQKRNWGHSPMEYAVAIAVAAGVKRLALFHHDPSHDDIVPGPHGARDAFNAGAVLGPHLDVLMSRARASASALRELAPPRPPRGPRRSPRPSPIAPVS